MYTWRIDDIKKGANALKVIDIETKTRERKERRMRSRGGRCCSSLLRGKCCLPLFFFFFLFMFFLLLVSFGKALKRGIQRKQPLCPQMVIGGIGGGGCLLKHIRLVWPNLDNFVRSGWNDPISARTSQNGRYGLELEPKFLFRVFRFELTKRKWQLCYQQLCPWRQKIYSVVFLLPDASTDFRKMVQAGEYTKKLINVVFVLLVHLSHMMVTLPSHKFLKETTHSCFCLYSMSKYLVPTLYEDALISRLAAAPHRV